MASFLPHVNVGYENKYICHLDTDLLFYISFLWPTNAWHLGFFIFNFILLYDIGSLTASVWFVNLLLCESWNTQLFFFFLNFFPFCCLLAGVNPSVEKKAITEELQGYKRKLVKFVMFLPWWKEFREDKSWELLVLFMLLHYQCYHFPPDFPSSFHYYSIPSSFLYGFCTLNIERIVISLKDELFIFVI